MNTNNDMTAAEVFQEETRLFLAGRMTEEQQRKYVALVQQDDTLREELAFAADLNRVLRGQELLEVNALIKAGMDAEPVAGRRERGTGLGRRGWGLMVGFLAVCVLGVSAWYFGSAYQQEQALAALLTEKLSPLEVVLYTGNNTDQRLSSSLAAYEKGQYAVTIQGLRAYYQESGDLNAGLYLGVSYLMEGQEVEAADWLSRVVRQGEEPASEAARWYLVLAELGRSKPEAAMELLRNWPQPGIYESQARDLLEELTLLTQ